ncbi:sodium:alanine symporter family protein [Anaeromyxobacter sp. Fw109-5]|uniref:alanine/glycine:cation symporter family protein n=1 Tax=Anaeromyxobacter sp. (strain Fw109-5) TaxID=404589 RepID=UPI000158A44E|nr:sodium:alanine symporter family protein [Anaeromyxobacter sp. Fw109-5]ABS27235.1 amino acid carrier protein [Anaeromyxobacter sp. Fw109-5]
MSTLQAFLSWASGIVWGVPTILLLVGTGLYLTLALRGLQFTRLAASLRLAFLVRKEVGAEGDVSHFQALMTALAATVGVGNIAGVATAIAAGGPGALFWMWVTGLVGMATKYAEALLGVKYRVADEAGNMQGGPMYYLARGVGGRWGRALGGIFALFAAMASFGIGNMVQSNSVADALRASFGIRPLWTGIVIAALTGLVIVGGIRTIGRVTELFVPAMILFYLAGGLVVLALNWRGIPDIAAYVLRDAFSPAAPVGAFLGATLRDGIRWGLARGVFSNESGLGTGGIAAAAAQTRTPAAQALVSMTQTFIDTIVVCSITGFTIIATGAWTRADAVTGKALTGAPLTMAAFRTGLPGEWGGIIVSVGLALFAFSTILGWAYYGERALEYLLGRRVIPLFRLLFVVGAFVGSYVLELGHAEGLELVWTFSDVMNGAMALPNLVGLVLLVPVVVAETRATVWPSRSHPAARG